MDQIPLVREKLEAGAKFLAELRKRLPIKTAFWLRESDGSSARLYIASDQIEHGKLTEGFRIANEAIDAIQDPNLNSFDIAFVPVDDPLVASALSAYDRYPGSTIPIHFGPRLFGKTGADEVYIYPLIQDVLATS